MATKKDRMQSTASSDYYTARKPEKGEKGKLRRRRYDPITRKHEIYEEAKLAK